MAQQIRQFTVAVPANTLQSALYTADLALGLWDIEQLDLEVPPGPSGLMGFYLALSGMPWIPFEQGEYFVWDDYQASWSLQDQPQGSGWQVVGYNLDDYDHSLVVRFHVSALTVPAAALVPAPLTIISSQPASGMLVA